MIVKQIMTSEQLVLSIYKAYRKGQFVRLRKFDEMNAIENCNNEKYFLRDENVG